ncbi:hypothetical protein MK489_07560, partial [Myxococcota bacterium]|nr:hypothetical protein [Myxococcota bacterium]
MPSRPSARWDLPSVAAALALAGVTLLLLYLCAAPVFTTDLWWHLKIGETYANQGPWPVEEPLLHTAHDDAPVQHEWLFGVWVHALQSTFGFHGLRVFHAAAAAGIVWLAFRLLRAHSTSHVTVLTGTTLFVVWASPRLAQLRPDLFSIAATLWLVAWLRQGSVPAIRWVWPAGAALMLIWANIHSLFAIGLCLALAALLGLALQAGLAHACRARWSGPAAPPIAARARRVTGFLLTGFGVSLLNPRGYQQHLTFFTSSRDAAIWSIADEWLPFDPLHGAAQAGVMSTPAWIGADTLLFLLVAVAGVGFTRFLRAPSAATLERFDPVGLGLALAGAVALAVSVRFAWMLILPLAYVSAHLEFAPARRIPSPGREDSRFAWPLAAAALGLAISYPQTDLYQNFRRYFLPTDLTTWLALPYRARPYHPEAVQFLANTGVEGKAFNTYPMGGFLAYWLAPRVRTFIDGRTEHYPSEVYEDYSRIVEMRGRAPGESFLDLLDRRGVDLFVGVGTPPGYMGNRFTTTHLQGEAGWLQVS